MEEGNPLTALAATGSVASRFVTQSEIDSAKERRDAEWKAAYARLGQEPPPRPTEDPEYDGRSLYERLQEQKTAKQEQWEEKNKLSNQFRALEEDEIHFLDGIIDEKITKERKRREEENEELKNFREAVSQRTSQQAAAPPVTSTSNSKPPQKSAPAAPAKPPAKKKNQRALLKGAIVRKPTTSTANSAASASPSNSAVASSATTAPAKDATTATSPQTNDATEKPLAPTSPEKNKSSVGQKRSELPVSKTSNEDTEEAQSAKRQKV